MKIKFRKKELTEGEQWFPTLKIEGVCSCADAEGPHVHTAHQGQFVLLEPGDWIVKESNGQGYYPIKAEIMEKYYEQVN